MTRVIGMIGFCIGVAACGPTRAPCDAVTIQPGKYFAGNANSALTETTHTMTFSPDGGEIVEKFGRGGRIVEITYQITSRR